MFLELYFKNTKGYFAQSCQKLFFIGNT